MAILTSNIGPLRVEAHRAADGTASIHLVTARRSTALSARDVEALVVALRGAASITPFEALIAETESASIQYASATKRFRTGKRGPASTAPRRNAH
jgi:hypothetical protein